MVQATPASRCEPTFRSSSETPALLLPKQRLVRPTSVMVRDRVQNVNKTNHQSPHDMFHNMLVF
jgi:hypothetical protein